MNNTNGVNQENNNTSIFHSKNFLYALYFIDVILHILIVIIALKYCKRFESPAFHFFFSFLLPPGYLIYKIATDGCESISKPLLAIILGIYILISLLLFYTISKNKKHQNKVSELIEDIKDDLNLKKEISKQQEIENEYKKRLEEKKQGIIYGTIVE